MLVSLIKKQKKSFIPEVIQSSAMDCGPASLKALLEGFGIPVSYGRLREACQTSVDGTSIDTLEEVSNQLGLEAEEIMLPPDHFFLPEAKALPAIVVVRLPSGVTHFVVVWERHGPFVQVMDPGSGRRWVTYKQFMKEVYIHRMPVSASLWREWAGSEAFLSPFKRRLTQLGISQREQKELIHHSLSDPGWYHLGVLDAATRMVDALMKAGGLQRGREAAKVLQTFVPESLSKGPFQESPIPPVYWSIQPMPSASDGEEEQLILKGMVLVRVSGRRSIPSDQKKQDFTEKAPLPLELEAALKEPPVKPGREILRFLRADGILTPLALGFAFILVSFGFILEAILLRSLFEIGRDLNLIEQRLGAMGALIIFSLALLLLELPIGSCILKLGRHLESRLRIAFLQKLPRLQDRYFQSRLNSDMAERSHSVNKIRLLPGLGSRFVRSIIEFFITAAAIVWLFPESLLIVLAGVFLTIIIPLASLSFLTERDLRVRSHLGALSRFYLDTLLGLVPTRAHSAQKPICREHESMLVEWSRASLRNVIAVLTVEAVQDLIGFGIAFWLLLHYYKRGGPESGVLLLVYWGLHLSALGQEIIKTARQYPTHRNIALRLMEPLGAPEENSSRGGDLSQTKDSSPSKNNLSHGISISMEGVGIKISGHNILEGVDLAIPPGAHFAIIGPSGAGKSSLVGLLLDWYRPSAGKILINGRPLTPEVLENMRKSTAWIDPAIQLWNRSLIKNIYYGIDPESASPAGMVMEEAQLMELLEKLPQGLGTILGEGGALVSGGEGQRVRLARAMAKGDVRLVILDEPFRGLDHQKRDELLNKARCLWKDATLICITHDISATKSFDRVIVIEHGKIVEQGAPKDLAEKADSFYRKYLDFEKAVTEEIWRKSLWRRISIKKGRIIEEGVPDGKV
ncbi:MAG: ATP-binding cassette domain-containing protein [bacterium]